MLSLLYTSQALLKLTAVTPTKEIVSSTDFTWEISILIALVGFAILTLKRTNKVRSSLSNTLYKQS